MALCVILSAEEGTGKPSLVQPFSEDGNKERRLEMK